MRGEKHKNPIPTVDIIIELDCGEVGEGAGGGPGRRGVVLIRRRNPPFGWAIPGGFVDEGETLEAAAVREALEETSLQVRLTCQLHAYSDPARDPRFHTVSVVFAATASGVPRACDDAAEAGVFTEESLPVDIAFDHARILADYFRWRRDGFKVFDI